MSTIPGQAQDELGDEGKKSVFAIRRWRRKDGTSVRVRDDVPNSVLPHFETHMKVSINHLVAYCAVSLVFQDGFAAPGDLDLSFGVGGRVNTPDRKSVV